MVLAFGIIALEIQDVPDVRAAPAIDRLVLVAHHADVAVLLGQQPHQVVLGAVGVLILVDHDVAQAAVIGLAGGFVVLQEPDGFQQQVVEIEGVRIAQRLLVLLEEGRHFLGFGIDGRFVDVRGRLPRVFSVADPRERRAVLQEFLLVEPERAVAALMIWSWSSSS